MRVEPSHLAPEWPVWESHGRGWEESGITRELSCSTKCRVRYRPDGAEGQRERQCKANTVGKKVAHPGRCEGTVV